MTEKGKFLREFNEAFARADIEFIMENITDDITWNLVGDKVIEGKEAFAKDLKAMANIETLNMSISHIITHGKTAAVNGTMRIKESRALGSEEKSFGFCDLYEFSGFKNVKIKKMVSYVVAL